MWPFDKKLSDLTIGNAVSAWLVKDVYDNFKNAPERATRKEQARLEKKWAAERQQQAILDADPAHQAKEQTQFEAREAQHEADENTWLECRAEMRKMGLDPNENDDVWEYSELKSKETTAEASARAVVAGRKHLDAL